MRVSFLNPPHPYLKQPDSQAPLGIMYLAALLEQEGHDVSIDDLTCLSFDEVHAHIPNADLYGITGTVLDIPYINSLIPIIRKLSDSPIIIGGPCSVHPEAICGHDSIVHGEGEDIILRILKDVESRRLKKFYQGPRIKNLDTLPLPARHLLSHIGGNVFIRNRQYIGNTSTVIAGARGCPFNCAFCCSRKLWGPRVRFRSVSCIVDEVKHVIDRYGIRQFRFSDDSLNATESRAMELAEVLRPLGIVWRGSIRTTINSRRMFKKMYKAGLREISPGIESFDQRVLDRLNKKSTVQDNIDTIKNASRAGINVRVLLMIKTPGQRPDTVEINIKHLKKLRRHIEAVACTTFIPLPGSDVWYHPKKYGVRIIDKDLKNYNIYMFGPEGVREMPNVISYLDRDDDEVERESTFFRNYLLDQNILNKG